MMRAVRVLLAGALTVGAMLFVLVAAAGAFEAQPFEVKVALHTTGPTTEVEDANEVRKFFNPPVPFTQAGGHPYALTTTFSFPTELVGFDKHGEPELTPTRDPKDIVVDLPPGLLGNPQAAPRCSLTQVISKGGEACPAATQVGMFVIQKGRAEEFSGPIVNLTPEAGQSAEFGLITPFNDTYLATAHVIRDGAGYSLTVVTNEIPVSELHEAEVTFWGVPADPSHDRFRGMSCTKVELLRPCSGGNEPSGEPQRPFLTMPSDCAAGPEELIVSADSWEEPGAYSKASAKLPAMEGCNLLNFDPTIEVQPDTSLADEPVSLGVDIGVPQDEEKGQSATPNLREAVVTLPEGMSLSPGIVDGIRACEESGPEGINFEGVLSEEVGLNGEKQLAPGRCPDASIIGTAEAETPLLPVPIKGHVYLAKPRCGGAGERACTEEDALDGNLYRLYLEFGGTGALADTGVNLKTRGYVEVNPATGQITTKVADPLQAPFSNVKISLNGGPRAPLDTPATCGPAVTTADFMPWSAPGVVEGVLMPGTPDATSSSYFDVEGCASRPGLSPGFLAGTVTPQAGQFSAFTMDLSRNDREQFVKGIQVHTPPGLLGILANVPLCGEPSANAGTCPAASKIGTTSVASGAGSHPFEIGGDVYLTGPYQGSPFGLSIVVHVVAGPFNLGVVVVRARIAVDPRDSTLTVTTDEMGPHAVPQIVFGVPVRLKRVTVDIDRPGFMFNPTNCAPLHIDAKVSGSQNATADVSSPFAVGGCKSLAFKPRFSIATNGHTSRAKGASLDVKLSYPTGSLGSEANIARVKVDLPKQLPSQLKTLQQACPAAMFAANPTRCPAASVVGVVRASTPLLPVGLSGPVYFVSHGGEEFPNLIIVLQGDGVRVDLVGDTFISKGITSSTFKTVPDVPVGTFELYLPQGKYPALAANGNLCKQQGKLKMPTEFVAQNGAVIHQTTKIAVTGCKANSAKAARRHRTGQRRAGK